MTTFCLIKQCSNCGSQFENRDIDEFEANDKESVALMSNYDPFSDTKTITITGCCCNCDEEDV